MFGVQWFRNDGWPFQLVARNGCAKREDGVGERLDLKRSAISGARWSSTTTVYTLALQFIQVAVLAHFLSPASLGLVGLVVVSVGFVLAFADLGLTNAIVQRQDGDDGPISSLFWLVVATGIVLSAVFYGTAPWAARFLLPPSGSSVLSGEGPSMAAPELEVLLRDVAPLFVVSALGHIPTSLHQRALRFRTLTLLESGIQTVRSTVTVVCAAQGADAHAVVYGMLAGGVTRSIAMSVSVWSSWRPSFRARRSDLTAFLAFGLYQMGERAVNFIAANVDYLIIGSFLGPAALGIYYAAYQLVILPIQRASPVLTRVAFPVFSRAQDDNAVLRDGYVWIARLIALVGFPALVGLGVTAPIFVPLLLGPGWSASVPLVQLLIPVGVFKSLGSPLGSIFLAKGRADLGLKWNAVLAIVNASAFTAVAAGGSKAVALAYVVTSGCALVAGQLLLKRMIALGVGRYLSALVKPLFASTAMGIVVALAQIGVTGITIEPLHLMLFFLSLGGSIYFLIAARMDRDLILEVRSWILGTHA